MLVICLMCLSQRQREEMLLIYGDKNAAVVSIRDSMFKEIIQIINKNLPSVVFYLF